MAYLAVLKQLVEVAQTVERLSNRNKKVRCENKQFGREARMQVVQSFLQPRIAPTCPNECTDNIMISQQHTHANTDAIC